MNSYYYVFMPIDLSTAELVVLQDDLYSGGSFVMKHKGPIDDVYKYGAKNLSRIIIPGRQSPLKLYMGILAVGVEFEEGKIIRETDLAEI